MLSSPSGMLSWCAVLYRVQCFLWLSPKLLLSGDGKKSLPLPSSQMPVEDRRCPALAIALPRGWPTYRLSSWWALTLILTVEPQAYCCSWGERLFAARET